MSINLNECNFLGYITKDLDLQTSKSGSSYIWIPFCVNDVRTDKDGNKTENPQFLSCKAFGKTAEACSNFLHKGSAVFLKCKATLNEWEKDGVKKKEIAFILEKVQFLDRAGSKKTEEASPAADNEEAF